MTPEPPYERVTLPKRFRDVPYDELPPAIKARVDRAYPPPEPPAPEPEPAAG